MQGPHIDAESTISGLRDRILERFDHAVVGIIHYGARHRTHTADPEALHDLLVVVKNYRSAYGSIFLPMANLLLPPNVFYLEDETEGEIRRAKFAVVSLAQLRGHCRRRCMQSYFFGRLAQPVDVIHAADDDRRRALDEVLDMAAATLIDKTAPLMPREFTAEELWTTGIEHSYRTEFRAEKKRSRAEHITTSGLDHYRQVTERRARELGWSRSSRDGEPTFGARIGVGRRLICRVGWFCARVQGRVLHVMRLLKGAGTFDGGLDYLVWKIERHSGVKVEVSDRARRYPRIFGLYLMLKVRRRGGFR